MEDVNVTGMVQLSSSLQYKEKNISIIGIMGSHVISKQD